MKALPAAALLSLGVLLFWGFYAYGPASFRERFRREVAARTATSSEDDVLVTEADLAALPPPVQRYLRRTGSVGQPRVRALRASWRGRIRAQPSDAWMPFTATQLNDLDDPARFFHMRARKGGLPVDVLHDYSGGAAAMSVRLLSLLPVTQVSGGDFTRAETVTLFNDICLLAPAALIDPAIRWEPLEDDTVLAHYRVGPHEISARLVFDDAGDLVNFISDDRLVTAADGSMQSQRWSTPVSGYRRFGMRRLMSHGEGRWHAEKGEYVYVELELLELETNPQRETNPRR